MEDPAATTPSGSFKDEELGLEAPSTKSMLSAGFLAAGMPVIFKVGLVPSSLAMLQPSPCLACSPTQ